VAAAAVIAAALLGCASNTSQLRPQPQRELGGHKADHSLPVLLPQQARDALAHFGALATSAARPAHAVSTALPYNMPANQQYGGPGDAGWVAHSSDVAVSPTGITLQAGGTDYPANFSYAIYRVDGISQTVTNLGISCPNHPPGSFLGVAAYNWAYGSQGRWEPLWYDAPIDSPPPIALDQTPGASFVSPSGDLAFALFCFNPGTFEVQGILVDADVVNPLYDEVEQNDTIETANALPAFPVSNFRGNVGVGAGGYDGDTDDYFSFSGSVGDMYRFTVTPSTDKPEFKPYAYDAAGNEIGEYNKDALGVTTVTVLVTTGQTQPLVLYVGNDSLSLDYTVSADKVLSYGEVEDNDTQPESTPEAAPVFIVNGNLGPNGNDGDSVDWYTFSASIGDTPTLVLWYDSATMSFDFDNNPPVIVDANGNQLCKGVDGFTNYAIPDSVAFLFAGPISPFDTTPFYLNVSPASGKSNYWFERYN